jgi:tRNA A-37 threonylcarbamoyl transferase component Bud32
MKEKKEIIARPDKKIYREGNTVVKMFGTSYSKADILNEALNHARVEETGLKIPQLLGVSIVEGRWSITTEWIEGRTMQEVMDENPERLPELMEQFVDLQLTVHKQRAPLLNKLKDKLNRQISSLKEELDATGRYELHTRIEGMPRHNKVLHGDFNPSNIIVQEDGTCYILDWSHATQGNGSADAGRTYLLFSLQDEKMADLYLDVYCRKADTARQYVQQWLPIVAAAQLTKHRPEETEVLKKWADVFEYQ